MGLTFVSMLSLIFYAQCQYSDTLSARVLWVKKIKHVYLIGVIPDHKSADKIIVASELTDSLNKKGEQIKVGKTYIWVIQEAYQIAYGPTKWSVTYGDTVVWTNKEPFKKQPRLCLNCNGKYIRTLQK
jgi:hypothetical protein